MITQTSILMANAPQGIWLHSIAAISMSFDMANVPPMLQSEAMIQMIILMAKAPMAILKAAISQITLSTTGYMAKVPLT